MAKTTKKLSAKKSTTRNTKKSAGKKTVAKKSAVRKVAAKSTGTKLKSEKKTAKPTTANRKLTVVKSKGKSAAKPMAKAAAQSSKFVGLLTPLEDRILVERLEASDRTAGGLFIPDMAQERPSKGKVVAVGHGRRDKKGRILPLDVKVGDLVLFTKWAGGEIQLDGSTFLIMRESDVLGVANS